MKRDMEELRMKANEAKILFGANALDEILFVTNKVGKTKAGEEYFKELRLITQDKHNFQIIDDKYSELYYGRLDSALVKLYMLLNGVKSVEKVPNEFKAYIEQYKDIKPDMVNKNIDTNEIVRELQK